ncbi:MAG: hypothetical protein HY832_03630 [Candidatus Aenigmarchaeota archaeon]|nr:hypothetical protein [Candidatus Aenigmarchaeota archaeon]
MEYEEQKKLRDDFLKKVDDQYQRVMTGIDALPNEKTLYERELPPVISYGSGKIDRNHSGQIKDPKPRLRAEAYRIAQAAKVRIRWRSQPNDCEDTLRDLGVKYQTFCSEYDITLGNDEAMEEISQRTLESSPTSAPPQQQQYRSRREENEELLVQLGYRPGTGNHNNHGSHGHDNKRPQRTRRDRKHARQGRAM